MADELEAFGSRLASRTATGRSSGASESSRPASHRGSSAGHLSVSLRLPARHTSWTTDYVIRLLASFIHSAASLRVELALHAFDQFLVELQEVAQEAVGDQEVFAAVRQGLCGRR
jgi:hypothetical protein